MIIGEAVVAGARKVKASLGPGNHRTDSSAFPSTQAYLRRRSFRPLRIPGSILLLTAMDQDILSRRKMGYLAARERHPERWSGNIRNWDLPEDVHLNRRRIELAVLQVKL